MSGVENERVFACPNCKAAAVASGERLVCSSCGCNYPLSVVTDKRVLAADLDLLGSSVSAAHTLARESMRCGPTGFGAVVTTGDGQVIVLRAPAQALELVAPVDIIATYGDGVRANAIWRGYQAQNELAQERRAQ